MYKSYNFEHKDFGTMEVVIGEGRILFSDDYLKKNLKVLNKELPMASDIKSEDDNLVYLNEVFEYIKYSKADKEARWKFEEWLEEVIRDCIKLS